MSITNVSEQVFEYDYNEALIHQVVVAYMAGSRQGSKAQKTRAEVVGSNKKPWRQKGSGRARSGNRKSPIWRSGGVTFAARSRNYDQKVNRKMYRKAMGSILSKLAADERLLQIGEIKLDKPSTKAMLDVLKSIDSKSTLIVTKELEENVYLSVRNIKNVDIIDTVEVNPLSLVSYDTVLVTSDALKNLEERFK
jgi:large subunit ribosomal protein L4